MPDHPDSIRDEISSDSGDDIERRIEEHFLEEDGDLRELLLKQSVSDPDRLLRLAALNDLAEEGLDLLAAEGVSHRIIDAETGRRIGPYRLIQEIGSGGMGVVFLAEDTALGRLVALKILSRAGEKDSERFRREAEITASLEHPNIVPVFGRGQDDHGADYLVMRYIAGKDIETTLNQHRAMDDSATQGLYDAAVRWMAQVARGLHHAHQAGVLHRDVKPSNILVEKDTPFIVDFGLASREEQIHLTQPGDMLGTVPYMSPEQIRGDLERLDGRADVYSAGATLYHLLAGVVPFAGRHAQGVARQILTRDPAALRAYGVPRDLEAIVFRCMEKEKERRYTSALALAEDLDRYAERKPVRARHLGPVRRFYRGVMRQKKKSLVVVTAVLAVVIGGMSIWTSVGEKKKAQLDVYAAAIAAAKNERFAYAKGILERLDAEEAGIPGLDESLSRMRKYVLRDQLMTLLYMRNSVGFYQPRLDGDDEMQALLEQADALDRPDILADHFRFIRIVVLKRRGEEKKAQKVLDDWQKSLRAPSIRTNLLTAYLQKKEGKAVSAAEVRALIDVGRPPTADDHYFAGLVLALFPGGSPRGLQEIDLWLQKNPSNYWGRFIRGNLLRQMGRYDAAREVYGGLVGNLASAEHRSDAESDLKLRAALYQRGILGTRIGAYSESIADFKRAGSFLGVWVFERATAHAQYGLGRFSDAVASYDRAIADLRRIEKTGNLRQRARARLEDSLAAVIKEKARAQMSLRRYSDAEATLARLAAMKGRFVEAEELTAFLLLEKARNEAGGDLSALREIAGEIREMTAEHKDSRNLRLMSMELRAKLGEDEERAAICNELYEDERVDPEFRVWRAWISFIFVEDRKRKFFDREQPDDLDVDLRNQWFDLEIETELAARRAADDLAVVGLYGFEKLDGIFRDAVMAEFLLAAMQAWAGEPRQAAAIFTRLGARENITRHSWAPLMFALHGHALEETGLVDEALHVYRRGLEQDEVDDWCLSRAPRLAARLKRWKDLSEILLKVKEKQPHAFWLKNELNHPDYEQARRESKLP